MAQNGKLHGLSSFRKKDAVRFGPYKNEYRKRQKKVSLQKDRPKGVMRIPILHVPLDAQEYRFVLVDTRNSNKEIHHLDMTIADSKARNKHIEDTGMQWVKVWL